MKASFVFNSSLWKGTAAAFMLIPLYYGWVYSKSFVMLDEDAVSGDGYASQVAHILFFIEGGGKFFQLEPLYWIHSIRTFTALVFAEVHNAGGGLLTAGLILACIWPLFALFDAAPRRMLALLLPLLVLMLSYRTVLVFVGTGYLLLYILHRRSFIYLVFSFIFANLSSGAVLTALMVAVLLARRYNRVTPSLLLFCAFLLLSLGISFADKYDGFIAQDAGYEASVQGATGVMALLSRSTIFVSLIEGDYLRAISYFLMFGSACFAFLYSMLRKKFKGYSTIFLFTLPVFLLEGLGVMSLLVPTLMFLAGVPLRHGFDSSDCLRLSMAVSRVQRQRVV